MNGRIERAEPCTVTVIVPVFNTRPFIRECVDSLLSERDFAKWQVLLVNDGSTDGCGDILREYAEKYANIDVLTFSEPPLNRGLSAARNLGLQNAQGQYVFFLDSDDAVRGNYISRLYDEITGRQCDIVYAGYSIWREDGITPVLRPALTAGVSSGTDFLEKRLDCRDDDNFVWCALYRTALLSEKGIRFEESLRLYEDIPFTLLAAGAAEKACALPLYDYLYRFHSGSLVHSGVRVRDAEYAIRVLKRIADDPRYHFGPVAWRFCFQVVSMILYYIGELSESGQITGAQRQSLLRELSGAIKWREMRQNARTAREKGKWLLWRAGGWRLFYRLVRKEDIQETP